MALPPAVADSHRRAGALFLRQAIHGLSSSIAGNRTVHGTGRGLVGGNQRSVVDLSSARPRGGHLDRRIRPHLLLPGRRGRPAHRFAVPAALQASSLVHVVTLGAFVWFGLAASLEWWWWLGVLLTAGVLVYEHRIVRPDDLSRVNRAFFTANGVIGIGLFVFALADLIAQGLRW